MSGCPKARLLSAMVNSFRHDVTTTVTLEPKRFTVSRYVRIPR